MRALYKRLRDQRRHARLFGVMGSVALLFLAVLVFVLVKSWPSTETLRERYFSSRIVRPVVSPEATGGTISSTTQSVAAPSSALSSSPTPATRGAPTPAAVQPAAASVGAQHVSFTDYLVQRFVDRADRSLRVCETLIGLRAPAPFDAGSFGRAAEQQVASAQLNPFVEVAIAPLSAALQLPAVAAVVQQIAAARRSGDLSILQRPQAFSNAASATSEIFRNQNALNQISQHAYHLAVIAKVAALAPSVANEAAFQSLCTQVEQRTLQPNPAQTIADVDQEKAAILQMIGSYGLTAEQVSFDTAVLPQVSITVSPDSVRMISPWMDRMFHTGVQLTAR